jgi:hypothetical protein
VNTEVTHVSDRSNAGSAGSDRSLAQKAKRTVQSKVLVPLAATAVSAGVSYLVKKLPLILEERVLPKLREGGAPELAKKVESVASAVPGVDVQGGQDGQQEEQDQNDQESANGGSPSASGMSNDEREAERRAREERRRERKQALSSA